MPASSHPSVLAAGRHRTALVCAGLLVAVTAVRMALSNPFQAVGFLYVIPICLAAVEWGVRGGILTSCVAFAFTIVWVVVGHVPLDVIAYGSRAAAFASISLIVGLQSEQRRRLFEERERLIEDLRATATRDQLTGLPNRRAWDDRVEHELLLAGRTRRPLTMAAFDLDGLKQVNDRAGHEEGDRLLLQCVDAWAGALRATDFLARVGGDEFLALLPGCETDSASEVVERALEAAGACCSFSVGLATWDGSEAAHALVRRADFAMYAAKRSGGGRMRVAPDVPAGRLVSAPG